MTTIRKDIIVIGASAGGYDALSEVLKMLPHDFPGSIIVVNHMSASSTGAGLVSYLTKFTRLPCKLAEDGEDLQYGKVYVAPADYHTLLSPEKIIVVRGPRENKFRPGIDPLFRSAAVAYSSRVIGIILTGMLEDGTVGMKAIKDCGGTTIVQEPEEAAFPDMPLTVQKSIKVDYTLSLIEIGNILIELVNKPASNHVEIPDELKLENEVAIRFLTGNSIVQQLGKVSPFVCPDCGGSLWQKDVGDSVQFRCHSGHSYDINNLLLRKSEGLEESFWISLRLLEEKKNILLLMAEKSGPLNQNHSTSIEERISEIETHINRLREFLFYHKTKDKVNIME